MVCGRGYRLLNVFANTQFKRTLLGWVKDLYKLKNKKIKKNSLTRLSNSGIR